MHVMTNMLNNLLQFFMIVFIIHNSKFNQTEILSYYIKSMKFCEVFVEFASFSIAQYVFVPDCNI